MMPSVSLLLCSVLAALSSGDEAVRDVLERVRYEAVGIDSGGRRVVAIRRPVEGPELLFHDTASGSTRTQRLPSGRYGYFRWSPSGEALAFLRWGHGGTDVWWLDVAGGDAVATVHTRSAFEYFWPSQAPDEWWVLDTSGDGRSVVVRRWSLDGEDRGDRARFRGVFASEARLSPDGRILAVTGSTRSGSGPEGAPLGLYLVHLDDRRGAYARTERISAGAAIHSRPCWSPDGLRVACVRSPGENLLSVRHRQIVVFDLARPARGFEDWTRGLGRSIGNGIYGTDEHLFFCPEGRRVWTTTQQGFGDHVLAVGDDGHQWHSGGLCSHKKLAVSADGGHAVSVQSSPASPDQLVLHDLRAGTQRVVDDANRTLRGAGLAFGQRLRFEGADGLPLEAMLLLPTQRPGPYPLLTVVHDGSFGRHSARFNDGLAQVFAAYGFAVLLPNTRGSAGYDQSFSEANLGAFGGREADDLLSAVEAAHRRRDIDAGRSFLYGHSYGGYLAAVALTRSELFRAAAVSAAVTDWESFYRSTDLPELAVMGLGGTPEQRPETYRRASPLSHAAQIEEPLLLIHGEQDRRVPPEQSRLLHARLEELGRTSHLMTHFSRGHAFGSRAMVEEVAGSVRDWCEAFGAGLR